MAKLRPEDEALLRLALQGVHEGDRRSLPLLIDDPDIGRWMITSTWSVVDGSWAMVGLEVQSSPRREVSSAVVRLLASRVRALKELGAHDIETRTRSEAALIDDAKRAGLPNLDAAAARLAKERDTKPAGRKGRQPLTDEHLAEVAAAYLELVGSGKPRVALAARFGVAKDTAGHWVQEARRRGLLGPTTRGRAGVAQTRGKGRERKR